MPDERDKPRPGPREDRLKIDLDFDDAAERLINTPPKKDADNHPAKSADDKESDAVENA